MLLLKDMDMTKLPRQHVPGRSTKDGMHKGDPAQGLPHDGHILKIYDAGSISYDLTTNLLSRTWTQWTSDLSDSMKLQKVALRVQVKNVVEMLNVLKQSNVWVNCYGRN